MRGWPRAGRVHADERDRSRTHTLHTFLRIVMLVAALILAVAGTVPDTPAATHRATDVKVTVLSTMLAGDPARGVGEWGYSALIEVDGKRLLLDTGARPETVLHNARELGIDLSNVTDLVLTHNHDDHTGGLLTLRRELSKRNATALSRIHVARGIFWDRITAGVVGKSSVAAMRAELEAGGARFIEYDRTAELLPGVWFTGPVPRTYPERNWSGTGQVRTAAGDVEDNVPDDASVVIDTPEGLVLVSGCGHAGIINTVEFAQASIRQAPVVAAIGGFHLFRATDAQLEWTASKLKAAGLVYLLGGHCTGIEAVYRIRTLAGLSRATAVVSAVGSSFTRGKGISALPLAG